MNPAELDACRTEYGGYTYWQGCGYGLCAASYNPLTVCKPDNVSYVTFSGDLSVLDSDLENGYPAVAWVDGGTHYVVVTGKNGANYRIHDPLYTRSEIYPGYIIHFVRYRGEFEPTPTPTLVPSPTPNPLWTHHLFIPALLHDSPTAPPRR